MKCGDSDSLLSLFESVRRARADARLTQDKVDVRDEDGGGEKSLAEEEEAGSSSSSPFIKRIGSD